LIEFVEAEADLWNRDTINKAWFSDAGIHDLFLGDCVWLLLWRLRIHAVSSECVHRHYGN